MKYHYILFIMLISMLFSTSTYADNTTDSVKLITDEAEYEVELEDNPTTKAFLDLLPFFGTGTALIPWAIIKLFNADYMIAIGLLIIWGVGQLARQLIQPKIVGDSIGVPPLPTLFLLFVGYKVAGVIGMILAVPIGIIIYTMYQEGAFDTSVNSLKILVAGINRFRKLNDDDMVHINPHRPISEKQEEVHGEVQEENGNH